MIRTLAKLLEKNNYEVMVAKNGEDALAMAEAEDCDLMIADIRMPGINGLEAVKMIQKNKNIPTIFITGYAEEGLHLKAERYGKVLFKPFEMTELMKYVKESLT